MAAITKKQVGSVGLGLMLYSIISLILDVLGLPADLDRWREILGPVTAEGLRQLAMLLGLMLLVPVIVELVSARWTAWQEKVSARRALEARKRQRDEWVRIVLPHMTHEERNALRKLLLGPSSSVTGAPGEFVDFLRVGFGSPTVLRLKPQYTEPLEKFFAEQDRELEQRQRHRVRAAVEAADKKARAVLWVFGKPHQEEPASLLAKPSLRGTVEALERDGILRIEWGHGGIKMQDGRPVSQPRKPVVISLTDTAEPIVSELIFEQPPHRRSVVVSRRQ